MSYIYIYAYIYILVRSSQEIQGVHHLDSHVRICICKTYVHAHIHSYTWYIVVRFSQRNQSQQHVTWIHMSDLDSYVRLCIFKTYVHIHVAPNVVSGSRPLYTTFISITKNTLHVHTYIHTCVYTCIPMIILEHNIDIGTNATEQQAVCSWKASLVDLPCLPWPHYPCCKSSTAMSCAFSRMYIYMGVCVLTTVAASLPSQCHVYASFLCVYMWVYIISICRFKEYSLWSQ